MPKRDMSSLKRRYDESYETRDQGAQGQGVLDYKKLKDVEVKFFSPKKGYNRINIVPYVIGSKNHPLVKAGKAKVGELDYVLDIWVHRGIGDGKGDYLCLKKTLNKSCPICEAAADAQNAGQKDEYDDLKATRRVFYNVIDVDNAAEGLQVLEASHFMYEKEIIEESRQTEDGDPVDFASPGLEGKIIKFKCTEETFNGNKWFKPKNYSFQDRTKPVSEKMIDSAISFDTILIVPTREDLEAVVYGGDADDDDDEDPKPRSGKKPRKDEDDAAPDDDADADEDDEDDDDDDDDADEDDEDDADDADEDDDDDADEDDDDDADDADDADDEPAPPPAKKSPAKKPGNPR